MYCSDLKTNLLHFWALQKTCFQFIKWVKEAFFKVFNKPEYQRLNFHPKILMGLWLIWRRSFFLERLTCFWAEEIKDWSLDFSFRGEMFRSESFIDFVIRVREIDKLWRRWGFIIKVVINHLKKRHPCPLNWFSCRR